MKKLILASAVTAVVTLSAFSSVMAGQNAGKGCNREYIDTVLQEYCLNDCADSTSELSDESSENMGSRISAFVQSIKDSGILDKDGDGTADQTNVNLGRLVSAYVHELKANGTGLQNNGENKNNTECVENEECVQNEEQVQNGTANGNGNANAGGNQGNSNNGNSNNNGNGNGSKNK